MPTVLISDSKILDLAEAAAAFGPDVEVRETAAREAAALQKAAADADALIVDSRTDVSRSVLSALDLAVVGRAGIGVDNVDVTAAGEHGVEVVHVPDYCVEEVSTHAVALGLACLRRLGRFDGAVRDGTWDWSIGQPIARLAGGTVGLVAFGDIARRTAEKFAGFGVDVIASDPYVDAERMRSAGVEKVGVTELLSRSDLCSIHAPLTSETRGLVDADAFERLPDHAVIVNTARGPIVDESALLEALETGEIAGAGLDVRAEEPPCDSPLHDRDDVVLTPHVGWYSTAARRDLTRTVVGDVQRVLDGDAPRNPVDRDADWL